MTALEALAGMRTALERIVEAHPCQTPGPCSCEWRQASKALRDLAESPPLESDEKLRNTLVTAVQRENMGSPDDAARAVLRLLDPLIRSPK